MQAAIIGNNEFLAASMHTSPSSVLPPIMKKLSIIQIYEGWVRFANIFKFVKAKCFLVLFLRFCAFFEKFFQFFTAERLDIGVLALPEHVQTNANAGHEDGHRCATR